MRLIHGQAARWLSLKNSTWPRNMSATTSIRPIQLAFRQPAPSLRSFHVSTQKGISATNNRQRVSSRVPIPMDNQKHEVSALLLRDACSCPQCVHPWTNQRLFSVADIPSDIAARDVVVDPVSKDITIRWNHDVPGFSADHTTTLKTSSLRQLSQIGTFEGFEVDAYPSQELWKEEPLPHIQDISYDTYMKDDKAVHTLVEQLRVHGLAFVTDVPGTEEAVPSIATRIGPVKESFYGHCFDVRTVPEAINAAYTSHDLGFHTDLLYFNDPPHVQLLHCVQSASTGGASVFADAYKAAVDLYHTDEEAFHTLSSVPVNYHYNHPDDNIYRTTKNVIELQPLRVGDNTYTRVKDYVQAFEQAHGFAPESRGVDGLIVDSMVKINWGPPFLAPFSAHEGAAHFEQSGQPILEALNDKVDKWHDAAIKFNTLLQRPNYLYERKMNSGDCVLFDNTRTLHSRRAFDAADVGKPRWLRGTYVDKDAYLSKLRVLQRKYRG